MEKTILGRTNLDVSAAGLGGGGFSRLGMEQFGVGHAAGLIRSAYEKGVSFFDTAMAYGTEPAFKEGLSGLPRASYVLSTKFTYTDEKGNIAPPQSLTECLENSLERLGTDYIDIYHLHGVRETDHKQVCETFIPEMIKAKEQGKIRFCGITERFFTDTSHKMLTEVLPNDFFDVIMTGYNMLNPSAAETVLPLAAAHNTGVLCMFAVRSALHDPKALIKCIDDIIAHGQGDEELLRKDGMLEFITESGAAKTIMEAAYRFCRHTQGIHVTLTGTKNADHLAENLESIMMPELPAGILDKLRNLFGEVDCISAQ